MINVFSVYGSLLREIINNKKRRNKTVAYEILSVFVIVLKCVEKSVG